MPRLLQLLSLVIVVLGDPDKHVLQGTYTTETSALTVRITYDESKPAVMEVYLKDYLGKGTFEVRTRKVTKVDPIRYSLRWENQDYNNIKTTFLRRLIGVKLWEPGMSVLDVVNNWAKAELNVVRGRGVKPLTLERVS